MSRVTRAASRAASRTERSTSTDQENLGLSLNGKPVVASRPQDTKRPVLGEIIVNDVAKPIDFVENVRSNIEATEIVNPKGRKGKKSAKKDTTAVDICHELCIEEDGIDGPVAGSLGTDPTPDDQTSRETQGYGDTKRVSEARDPHASSPSRNAILLKCQENRLRSTPQQSPSSTFREAGRTPKFDPELHRPVTEAEAEAEAMESLADSSNDSFVKSINSPTSRASSVAAKSPELENKRNADDSDSFVDEIRSRSPAKLSNAPQDPIDALDALDALEDEIERVTKDLPTVVDNTVKSPMTDIPSKRTRPSSGVAPRSSAKKSTRQTTRSPPKSAPTSTKPPPTSLHVAKTAHKATVQRPLSKSGHHSRPSTATKASKARSSLVANIDERRTSISTRKPAFVPAKSTKAPTQPTFVLPSDAISARKKAEKEARLKAEQEEIQGRRSFKAKPIRVSSVQNSFPVRATASSQARASLARQDEKTEGGDVEASHKSTAVRAPRVSPVGDGKALTVAKRSASSTASSNGRPQQSQSRSNSSGGKSRTSSITLNPGPVVRSTVTKADSIRQKARAKEICGRDKVEQEERERQRREKEAAAKKARAEAAERGRIASREWAEKQKKRKMESEKQRLMNGTAVGNAAR